MDLSADTPFAVKQKPKEETEEDNKDDGSLLRNNHKKDLPPSRCTRSSPTKPNGVVPHPALNDADTNQEHKTRTRLKRNNVISVINERNNVNVVNDENASITTTNAAPAIKSSRGTSRRTTTRNANKMVTNNNNNRKGVPTKDGLKSTQMTDFFPIRRSERKPKATLLYERQMDIERKILEGSEDGLKVSKKEIAH